MLEGWDTAFKVLILARAFWEPDITLASARVEGIAGISESDLSRARGEGKEVRLLGRATRGPAGEVEIRVGPEILDASHPLYPLEAGEKGAVFDSDLMGRLVIRIGKGGPLTTAASLVKDLLNIARHPSPLAL